MAISSTTMDAALWGFGRTAMNEMTDSSVRLVDIDPATPVDAVSFLLGRELAQPDTEQEITFTLSGERLAHRLRLHQQYDAKVDDSKLAGVARLAISVPGQLRNLQWQTQPAALPQENEVEIEVCAAGLNLKKDIDGFYGRLVAAISRQIAVVDAQTPVRP